MTQSHDHALENVADPEAMQLEDTLWWMQGRKHIIRKYLRRANATAKVSTVMDIGCGSGGNFDVLAEFGRVIGVDRSAVLVRRAQARGIASAVYEADFHQVTGLEAVDMFTLFDVIEHVEDDAGFVAKLHDAGANGHMVLISVPACPFLYGEHDRLLSHYRRYTKRQLELLLSRAGYEMLDINYFMFFLFPVVALSRIWDELGGSLHKKSRLAKVRLGAAPRFANRILVKVLNAEANISRHVRFPIGVWLFALVRHVGR